MVNSSQGSISEILNKTADLFERSGWPTWKAGHGGVEYFNTYHTICMAARDTHPTAWRSAITYFAEAVGCTSARFDDAINWLNYDWDRAPGRTQAQVVAALRAAAEPPRPDDQRQEKA